ncbi:beta-lactamase family protein [Nocardioides piscis]|uniref:Beta-lactamase family protein n=1 Tax=Nocardioides piscis TaxID=2714938 RepID=A0A6G7YI62_9ACTN|nr:beta-lactamase family protein [Nocardioides piscis]
MSEPVSDLTAHRLRWLVARAQADGRVPSVVAGVVRDGGLAWSCGVGQVPGEVTDTQYKIGSITKTFTAVLILQLVEEGRLSLDAPASEVLGDVGYADRSIRQLLAHSGGLQAEPVGSWWERTDGGDFDALAAANDGSAAAFDPDRRFHYSNLGYGLLGEVVARLRGVTWWEATESRLLRPLGMSRTSYQASGAHAEGWSVHPYSQVLIPEPLPDTAAMAPAGQVWSTLADLATYCDFLLHGHDEVLPASVLAQAFTPQSGRRGPVSPMRTAWGSRCSAVGPGPSSDTPARCRASTRSCWSTGCATTEWSGWSTAPRGCPWLPSAPHCSMSSRSGSRRCLRSGSRPRPCRPSSSMSWGCGTGARRLMSSPARALTWWRGADRWRYGASQPPTDGSSAAPATTPGRSCVSSAARTARSPTSTSARSSSRASPTRPVCRSRVAGP